MRYISEKEYNARLKQIRAENLSRQRRKNLKAEKRKYQKPIKLPTTSKLILLVLILINIQIILFVEKAMMQWGDFSAAYALIGIPATLTPVIWGYYSKSKAENTSGGIVYDMAMTQLQMEQNISMDIENSSDIDSESVDSESNNFESEDLSDGNDSDSSNVVDIENGNESIAKG